MTPPRDDEDTASGLDLTEEQRRNLRRQGAEIEYTSTGVVIKTTALDSQKKNIEKRKHKLKSSE